MIQCSALILKLIEITILLGKLVDNTNVFSSITFEEIIIVIVLITVVLLLN